MSGGLCNAKGKRSRGTGGVAVGRPGAATRSAAGGRSVGAPEARSSRVTSEGLPGASARGHQADNRLGT